MTKEQPTITEWIVITSAGLALALVVAGQIPGANGSLYWPWVNPPRYSAFFYMGGPFLIVLFAGWGIETAGVVGYKRIALLAASCFLLQLGAVAADTPDLSKLAAVVRSAGATSYFTDATQLGAPLDWLPRFHETQRHLHSSTHPPGPILFYSAIIGLVGQEAGPFIGGLVIAFITSLGVPAVYQAASLWRKDPKARFYAATLYAILPALILFTPELDQIYPILTVGIIYFWERSLRDGPRYAVAVGVISWVASFMAYNFAVLGIYAAIKAIFFMSSAYNVGEHFKRLASVTMVILLVMSGIYTILFLLTGFQPVATFFDALSTQERLRELIPRPDASPLLLNLYGFILGGGAVIPLLALFHVFSFRRGEWEVDRSVELAIEGLLTTAIVGLSGLLDYETARVWLFLQPFFIIPAGFRFAGYSLPNRVVLLILLFMMMVVLKANILFIQA